MDQPIDLTASSDDEQSSGPVRPRKPNWPHHGNDVRPPRDTVDLTIDEPDCDPYRMVRSPLYVPGSLQSPYRGPAIPGQQEPTMSRPNGAVLTLQGPDQRHISAAGVSNVDIRANSAARTLPPPRPYRSSVAPAPSMGVRFDAFTRPPPLGQGSAAGTPVVLASPIAPVHLNVTTPTHDMPAVAKRPKPAIPMYPHPHLQSPAPARITPKLELASRSQAQAPTAAHSERERSPLPKLQALLGMPGKVRSADLDRKSESDHTLNMPTGLGDPRRSSDLPLTIESFQECLQKAIRELRTDHQYYVKSLLPRARHYHFKPPMDCKTSTSGVFDGKAEPRKLGSFWQATSPFADLKPLMLDQSPMKADDVGQLCQLGPKVTKQAPEVAIVPCIKYTAGNLTIPPYTNYISTKRNILIEDDKNRTFLPYYGDDAYVDRDYAELESRITQNRVNYHRSNAITEKARLYGPYAERFLAEVGCTVPVVLRYLLDETLSQLPAGLPYELAAIWQNREVHLDDEYYDDSDSSPSAKSRSRLRKRKPRKQWQALFQSIPPPATGREYAAAGIACAVFASMTGFSLWHVVRRNSLVTAAMSRKLKSADSPDGPSNAGISLRSVKVPNLLDTYTDLGCLVCFAHECPGHGEFGDEDEEKNIRVRINAKPDSPTTPNRKANGAHLVPNGTDSSMVTIEDALGMDDDNKISGTPWIKFKDDDSAFKDDELCSDKCFWSRKNRSTSLSAWTEEETQLFQTLAPAYINIRRGPCLIALAIEKPCHEIFLEVLKLPALPSIAKVQPRHAGAAQGNRPAPRRHFDYWLENSITWEHHERPPFKPCNHAGPCSATTNCHCYEDKVTCEKTCMCAESCSRKYRGCACAARGKVCWQNEKCDCYRLNRECDPDLCSSCGAHEVLDPANRYRPDITDHKCANVYVQRGIPRRTLLGHSKLLASGGVDGWGLYMGEPTRKGDYIGEYVGEVISKEESEQRGIIYNKRNLSYLFDLNSTQTLDSTLVGNKFRYINHQAPPYANCQAKTLFCNTVHRIGMFACRNIEVGEEILFDYGEGFAAKFDLIKLDVNAQPKIEHRRKGVAYPKLPDKAPTLSKNGKKIGRPRKNAPSDQGGVKENLVESAAGTAAPASRKKSHKRKPSPPLFGLDGAADEVDTFDDVPLSDDAVEEISSSESFHESDDEDARIRRRRITKDSKISAAQKRGCGSKVGKKGSKRGRGGRFKSEKSSGALERRSGGGKRETRKCASSSRTVKIEEVDGTSGELQERFDRIPLPSWRAPKTRRSAMEKGDRGVKSDAEMGDIPPPDTFASTTPRNHGRQTRYANMDWGEGSSAAEVTEEYHAPKRALKSYANMQKRRDVRSILKSRLRKVV